jgi:hypothetical protein
LIEMCDTCLQTPCAFGCPNHEPEQIFECGLCDQGIIAGETYAEIEGKKYHLDCLDELSISELVELCGYETYTAKPVGKEDVYEYLR